MHTNSLDDLFIPVSIAEPNPILEFFVILMKENLSFRDKTFS